MRFLKSEAGAIVLWLVAALFLAALFTPHLYDAGKTFAENAKTVDYPSWLESLAGSADRAKLDRYFSRCLLISALVLLPFLIRRVRRIPKNDDPGRYELRKLSWGNRFLHLACGLLIGALALGGLALIFHFTGVSTPNGKAFSFSKLLSKALVPALGAGIIEELLFRGLLLGLWLRAYSVWSAWIGSSLMFSFVHFLKPSADTAISDPTAWHSGFEILGSTLGHFTNPLFFVTDFATLTLLGLILAYTRTRTRSLWFPIGLHAGLVFALKTFSITQRINPESSMHPWLIGADLKSGMLPLAALAICLIACIFSVRKLTKPDPL
ncbi:MAG: CPBP family intramembrane glutamic endopeptidase [Verrucomicrobiota bacterium]